MTKATDVYIVKDTSVFNSTGVSVDDMLIPLFEVESESGVVTYFNIDKSALGWALTSVPKETLISSGAVALDTCVIDQNIVDYMRTWLRDLISIVRA